ncbi:MAG: RagB/SusD family nutrient uptake outer membrane protein [Prolixibacteraceae bacterium]|nr:RagB/SusD family nutrient uptake outer membrane protein [Prolixibacteraceae bacterium]
MKKNKITSILIVLSVLFSACESILAPVDENRQTLEDIYEDPAFAEGLLMNAYTRLPNNYYSFNDVATDDAVTNDKFNDYLEMATGQWSAFFNPVSEWDNSLTAILYLNKFLEESSKVEWSYTSDTANILFNDRLTGEAYALRGIFMFYLLQAHGGYGPDGTLLGVPIITESMDANSDFNRPRATFDECVKQIYSDLSKAEEYLPLNYIDALEKSEMPARYQNYSVEVYNRVFGEIYKLRVNARIAKAMKAKTALLAASDAYRNGTSVKWDDAANYAAELIKLNGGVARLDNTGHIFYKAAQVGRINLSSGRDQAEMIWRSSVEGSGSTDREQANFPPSLFGNGRVNPTQNLVDAFPMANGYPISDSRSGFDPKKPYDGRDPRLKEYILYNQGTIGANTIRVSNGSGDDAVGAIRTSTRTGYYLKKLLREDVNLNPASRTAQQHYTSRIRMTEIYLIYAEAANEAWGPNGAGAHGFSAKDVLTAIRKRAGIKQPDDYLNSINSKEEMRELIRNERRLELCFEGFRFWDLRRWKANLNEAAKGVKIDGSSYAVSTVENRNYSDFMYHGPLPYGDVLKFGYIQNQGW